MLALSIVEGFARGFLSLHRAALSASRRNSANSNYSRTYGTPGGGGVPVCRSDHPRNSFPCVSYEKTGEGALVIPMITEYLLD